MGIESLQAKLYKDEHVLSLTAIERLELAVLDIELSNLDTEDYELIQLASPLDPDLLFLGKLDRNPTKSNWVEDNGGLPAAIEDMADSIHRKRGFSISKAIAIAVSQAKKLAAKGNAKYIKAVAAWEALKAKARAKKAT